jgi:hypothetical protein
MDYYLKQHMSQSFLATSACPYLKHTRLALLFMQCIRDRDKEALTFLTCPLFLGGYSIDRIDSQ